MTRALDLWKNFWTPVVSGESLGVLRFLFFSLGAAFFFKFHFDEIHAVAENWHPIGFFTFFESPFLTGELFALSCKLGAGLSILASVGLLYRLTGPLAAVFITTLSGYSSNFGDVSHAYCVFSVTSLILGFSPASHHLSFDRWIWRRERPKASWAYGATFRLIMVHIVWVMMVNGISKLYFSGTAWVLSDNFLLHMFTILDLPHRTLSLIQSSPDIFMYFAGAALLMQLTSWAAFVHRYFALFYFFIWSSFHLGVTLLMGGHLAFYSQILCYLAFPIYHLEKPRQFKGIQIDGL